MIPGESAEGAKGCQFVGLHQHPANHQKEEDGPDLDQHHNVVGPRGLTNSPHQQHGQDKDDEKSRKVEVSSWLHPSGVQTGEDHLSGRCIPNEANWLFK